MNELFGALKPLALLETVAELQHPATLAELAVTVGVPKTDHASLAWFARKRRTIAADARWTPLRTRRTRVEPRLSPFCRTNLRVPCVTKSCSAWCRMSEQSCNLTILDGTEVTYLDRVESKMAAAHHLPAGIESPGLLFGERKTLSRADAAGQARSRSEQNRVRTAHGKYRD